MRKKYILTFIILLIIEYLIGTLKQGIIRENIGDILVVPCIYTLLRIILPNKIKHLSLYVLVFAIIIELLQLSNITTLISNNNKILNIALGSTFDIKDIISYTIGYILIILIEHLTKKVRCFKYTK